MTEKQILSVMGQVDEKYIEEAAPGKRIRRKRSFKKAAVIAACLCLLFGLSAAAYTSNWFGLRDLLLPVITGESLNEESGAVSLAGYQGSPEWKALAEWRAFVSEYDPEGSIFQAADGRLDASFARYSCYLVYSREMAEKMDEITAKYGLKLHTTSFDLQKHPELVESLGGFMRGGYYIYMYEDGTFQVDGTIDFADIGAWDFQLLRSVRGTFHDAMLDIGDVSEYQEAVYETACGVNVTLALGQNKVLILADLEDSFVTVHIPYGSNSGIMQSHLETLADSINFAALTPAVGPQTGDRTQKEEDSPQTGDGTQTAEDSLPADDGTQTAEKDMETRGIYAAVLRNLLYNNVLPDGEKAQLPAGGDSSFSVCDVDGDGKEELILFYVPNVTAGEAGYIIGYDTTAQTTYIQLREYPCFAFLDNGNLKALSSHNQTWGEMWPYSLYQYLPESDSYEYRGCVSSEDKKIFESEGKAEKYPDYADASGTGTVYYFDWGTTPVDEADYLAWLEGNRGNTEELEIEYLPFTEENILKMEQ